MPVEIKPGDVFTRWKVLEMPFRGHVVCECRCGVVKAVRCSNLIGGKTKSCGCFKKDRQTKHGMHRTPTYKSWERMRCRCNNPNDINYANYGGRGITVCERWNTFENFYDDMGERPEGASIDRVDNSKGYSPDNCRWSSRREQQNNMRSNKIIEHNNRRMTLSQWSSETGIKRKTISSRLDCNWPIEKALTTPVKSKNHHQQPKR